MDNCLVVCEFNPFHKGHEYLIKKIKEQNLTVICLMSGNATQRGELAIVSKYARAEMAIEAGVDLVIEYPFPFCSTSANSFSENAMYIADKLGNIKYIAFGSETNDLESIEFTANILNDSSFNEEVKNKSKRGERYTTVLKRTYKEKYGECNLFDNSNDILNLQYIKALKSFNSSIKPLAIKREGECYNDIKEEKGFLSATHIRNLINSDALDSIEELLPEYSNRIIRKQTLKGLIYDENKYYNMSRVHLNLFKNTNVNSEINEELYNRMKKSAIENVSMKDFINMTSNKIYSESKVRRALIHFLCNQNPDISSRPNFVQVLGFTKEGRNIIKDIKEKGKISIITKQADYIKYDIKDEYETNMKVDSIWESCLKTNIPYNFNFKHKPIIK